MISTTAWTSFGSGQRNVLKLHANLHRLAVMPDTKYKRAHIAALPLLLCDLEADPR